VQVSLRKLIPIGFVVIAVAGWFSREAAWLAALVTIAGNALIAFTFAQTLRPGHEPLIATISRLARGHLAEEVVGYARGLTIVWAAVMTLLTVELIVVAVVRPDWLGGAVTVNIGLVVALFAIEHVVRARVFPHLPMSPPLRTGRIVWQALRERR
jgi:uncharacterized membrane protein